LLTKTGVKDYRHQRCLRPRSTTKWNRRPGGRAACFEKGNLRAFHEDDHVDPKDLLTMPCDILVPAAVDRVITEATADKLKCRILAEAANGPTTPEADLILEKRWDGNLCHPGHLVQCRRRDRFLFRVGAGLQAFMWSERSD